MKTVKIYFILCVLMCMASLASMYLTPHQKMKDLLPPIDLEGNTPKNFGDWELIPNSNTTIVNPALHEVIVKLYSQVLTRTYLNRKTQSRIMLSIAYGGDQSDDTALHVPDACYPAQGFNIKATQKDKLSTAYGDIKLTRLLAVAGDRYEPVTYWTTIGSIVTVRGLNTKMVQISYGLKGLIADGLVFRVSTVDANTVNAYALENAFIRDLLQAVKADYRLRLAGV